MKQKAGSREAVEASIDAAKNDKDATYTKLARQLPASIETWESVAYPEADPRRPAGEDKGMIRKKTRWPAAYRRVSGMSGQELLDGLAAAQELQGDLANAETKVAEIRAEISEKGGMPTLMRAEVKLRLVNGLKQRQGR